MAAQHDAPSADDSGSRSGVVLGSIVSTYCIAVLMIILRTSAKRFSKAGFWLDDWMIYTGTVTSIIVHA